MNMPFWMRRHLHPTARRPGMGVPAFPGTAGTPPGGTAQPLRSGGRRAIGSPSAADPRPAGQPPGRRRRGMISASLATAPASSAELLGLAESCRVAGDYQAGSVAARQAAALAAETGDAAAQATALRSLATQLMRLGELENAVAAGREAIAVLECTGDEAGICQALTIQAMPLNDLGMHQEALEVLAQAREIAQRLGDRSLLYWVHNRTGVVHGSMGNRALSSDYLMRALGISEGMDAEARFCILNNLGDNAVYEVARLRDEGEPDRAERM